MKIFLDSTDPDAVERWLPHGLVDGITTNPTLLRSSGAGDHLACLGLLAKLVFPRDVSVQVAGGTGEDMIRQAEEYTAIGGNIVVKVPVIRPDGSPNLDVMCALAERGVPVNATACLSLAQVLAAAKAGARYASLLWGRVSDEGGSPEELVSDAVRLVRGAGLGARVLVGSVRSAGDITRAFGAGADVVTVPPSLLGKWLDHRYSRATVHQFNLDAEAGVQA